jgi:hypothetical protein
VAFGDGSPANLEPIAIGWLADLVAEIESALGARVPTGVERTRLLSTLPQLRNAVNSWIGILDAKASGEDVTDSVWLSARELTHALPAELEPRRPEPDREGVLPHVARNSMAGEILFAQMSRAFEPDPFRDAVSALGDVEPSEVTRLAHEARTNADRASRSIDACLRVLGVESI